MFQQLLESNVVHRPRVGGSVVSTLTHVALIAGAVTLTANAHERTIEQPEVRVPFVQVVPPPSPPLVDSPRTASNTSASNAPSAPTSTPPLTVSDIVLDVLPPIDLTRAVASDQDFARSRAAHANCECVGVPGLSDPTAAWSAEQVDKPVMMTAGSPMPSYPDALRTAGIAGGVMVEFVVDTTGRVERGSERVLTADHEAFSVSVRAVLSRLRFLPAEANGRKVRQLVRLPLRFDLNSR